MAKLKQKEGRQQKEAKRPYISKQFDDEQWRERFEELKRFREKHGVSITSLSLQVSVANNSHGSSSIFSVCALKIDE